MRETTLPEALALAERLLAQAKEHPQRLLDVRDQLFDYGIVRPLRAAVIAAESSGSAVDSAVPLIAENER